LAFVPFFEEPAMRTPRLALLFAGACTAFGCVDPNAVDSPQEQVSTPPPSIQPVPGATALGLVQPYPVEQTHSPFGIAQPLAAGQIPRNLIDMQRLTYTEFANTMDFGFGRMTPPPGHRLPYHYAANGATLDFTQAYPPESPWHGYWIIDRVQLIGTIHDEKGTAYDTKSGDWQRISAQSGKNTKDIFVEAGSIHSNIPPTRTLNEFETETLKDLHAGAQLQVKADGDTLRVIGAIRAMTNNCMTCHSVPEGHLMGAFTYELRRVDANHKTEAEKRAFNPPVP